jgi:hypothetical protein
MLGYGNGIKIVIDTFGFFWCLIDLDDIGVRSLIFGVDCSIQLLNRLLMDDLKALA